MATPVAPPVTDVDLWSDDVLADPYPTFARLRDLGAVVRVDRHGVHALTRFEAVRSALTDWETFSSAAGTCLEPSANAQQGESILSSDPPAHTAHRRALASQLSVRSLAEDAPHVELLARDVASRLTEDGTVDVVADLARPFALRVLGDLLGLDHEGREHLPAWSERAFDVFGPHGERFDLGLAAAGELVGHVAGVSAPGRLRPGSRGAQLVERGAASEIINYTWPGLATTADALGTTLHLLARHPEQWELVRDDPSLVPGAFREALRLHAPIHYFTRLTSAPVTVDGVEIAAGSRVLLMFGSANRDERRYPDPDVFDVTRDAADHLAFGRGVHRCPGMNLATLEAEALLTALTERVQRLTVAGEPEWVRNGTLHGLRRAPVAVTLAAQPRG